MDTPNDGRACAENDKVKKLIKGFLACVHSFTVNFFTICLSLFGFSCTYPLSPKALLSFGDTWMQVITIASLVTLISSWILSSLASYLKDNESFDADAFKIFKWLLLSVLLLLWTVICIALRFCAHISSSVVWPLGITGSCLILYLWYLVFYVVWPKILEDEKEGNVGGNVNDETRNPGAALATGLDRIGNIKNWTKAMCKEIVSYFMNPRSQTLPE